MGGGGGGGGGFLSSFWGEGGILEIIQSNQKLTYLKYSVHYGPLFFLFRFVFFQQGTVFLCNKKPIETELCYSAVLPSFLPFLSL